MQIHGKLIESCKNTRHVWLAFAVAGILAVGAMPSTAVADPSKAKSATTTLVRPNIVFILTDDQRWDTISANVRAHTRDYYASVEQMDQAVGRLLDELDRLSLRDKTWILFMGDNGWFLGEHGMTSKVLPYEESMRVPMAIAGPKTPSQVVDDIVLNIDLTATIYELAGLPVPKSQHGRSLLPIVLAKTPDDWRKSFLYEAPTPQLGSQPLWAIRDAKWKYVRTDLTDGDVFHELYDLDSDSIEQTNVADHPKNRAVLTRLSRDLAEQREVIAATTNLTPRTKSLAQHGVLQIPDQPPRSPRTDLFISGVYPHLTTYGVYSQNGAHGKDGHNECGIGAVVPWAGKLWMVNYAPHMPKGSEHKLYSIEADFSKPMKVHPESVGGTPAGRMIHKESNQLLIGHHIIDAEGNVRTIQPADMPIRVTAMARHLNDPANSVYYIDMEGSIWEANVHTLAVNRLFKKPVPGWHGKGAYTSQGRLVVSNNGELHVGTYKDVLVGGEAKDDEERGVLAEWDGDQWRIVERRQFTEVTGPNGISGGSDGNDPIWSMGWDRRSLRFKLLEDGRWHTYLLPKAAYCNDATHGWYTEWPRIREITDGRWMMDMHGMFFDFPKTFSSTNSAGIKPIGSHLRYVPDFCGWNGRLVLATDETSIQGNPLAGQPQSNLWFGNDGDLREWGPASGYGGPWMEDMVTAHTPSDPFLVAGFDRRILHLALGPLRPVAEVVRRATDQLPITNLPDALAALPRVTIPRGDWHQPAAGFGFNLSEPATVYLAVDGRGKSSLPPVWKRTDLSLTWGKNVEDPIYVCQCAAGNVSVPSNSVEHSKGAFGTPHMAFVKFNDGSLDSITPVGNASVTKPLSVKVPSLANPTTVHVKLQVDRKGNGVWTDFETIALASDGYVGKVLPNDLDAVWLRLSVDRDCVATAILHQTTSQFVDGDTARNQALFAGLADVGDEALSGSLYPAKRNRNLRVITDDNRFFDFTKADFVFVADQNDAKLAKLLSVKPEFSVDEASVILEDQGKRLRLPKGDALYDKPFASGWPRASREVESERHLANIHGTFYEVPLVTNGAPPAWNLIRPVSSHSKQITDYCSWNGLLVLSGIRPDATNDGHIFRDDKHNTALWFGGIDDLWKLGKPIGHGGPWLNTAVKSGVPSDPYLMKGYDQKTARLSHDSEQAVTVTLQVDLDGTGLWVDYRKIVVPPRTEAIHKFAPEFSACWIRGVSNRTAQLTLQFDYQ
ncbi:sulfatase/phosphatase domain-containing protein [Novipirellula artificiosorum]|uniref:Choline-sulfatase n=1 Tax=Novipirellula artificiosorum TaxID=2528016 RepID=A0A5C6E554_9BACT|nr:sulfatase/phosphatase domain-containing protein [Novipirellula artificiosorum]TWU42556.1 Choline-sulfatase [Novipirellula artificiosorum]